MALAEDDTLLAEQLAREGMVHTRALPRTLSVITTDMRLRQALCKACSGNGKEHEALLLCDSIIALAETVHGSIRNCDALEALRDKAHLHAKLDELGLSRKLYAVAAQVERLLDKEGKLGP